MDEKIYENARIVIVDDVEEVLHSAKNCLEFEGMQVKCFNNPLDGLEYLKCNKDDVLLLDFFMPQMNGDDFVKELRKYNQETIVILQTGYSDKIPPLEMIDRMNIQGYLDKMKGEDELILMTKAAVKTSFLNKSLREKDKEIAVLSYKKATVGDLISHLINESKDQLFSIASMNEAIKEDSEEFTEETRIIKNSVEKISELYDALNFEEQKTMNAQQLIKTLKELLKAKMLVNNSKLEIDCADSTIIIDNDADELIYLLLKIVDLFVKENSREIKIKIEEIDGNISYIIKSEKDSINLDIEELDVFTENEKIKINIQKSGIELLF